MGIEGEEVKAEVGAEAEGDWSFEGVASSTALDRQRERMTRGALAGVAEGREVALVLAHQETDGVVGTIEECQVDGELLRVRGRLRADEPLAGRLRERLEQGERLGLSLGGKVTRAHWGWDANAEGPVRHLDEVAVEHVAVCQPEQAVNPDVWVGLVGRMNDE